MSIMQEYTHRMKVYRGCTTGNFGFRQTLWLFRNCVFGKRMSYKMHNSGQDINPGSHEIVCLECVYVFIPVCLYQSFHYLLLKNSWLVSKLNTFDFWML